MKFAHSVAELEPRVNTLNTVYPIANSTEGFFQPCSEQINRPL